MKSAYAHDVIKIKHKNHKDDFKGIFVDKQCYNYRVIALTPGETFKKFYSVGDIVSFSEHGLLQLHLFRTNFWEFSLPRYFK